MTKYNARYIAIETLDNIEKGNTPLPIVYQQLCNFHELSSLDRSLGMKIIYGVLRQKQYLEVLISRLCKIPLKKLHPLVRHALAVGLYQIVFLSRIPESAAVNETVNGAKATKMPKRLHGFVNGVLRQSIRQKKELPKPGVAEQNHAAILNHPEWMTNRWAANFGTNVMQAICLANNEQQVLTLRINTLKISVEEYLQLLSSNDIKAKPGRYAISAVNLPEFQGAVTALPGYEQGFFQVQGESAQLASLLLCPIMQNGRYLDGCAGLGGKTGHLLELVSQQDGKLIAIEPEQHRQEKLLQNLAHFTDREKLTLFRGSLQEYNKTAPPHFHGILIDAPCSGTGITARHPDIRWRRELSDIAKYSTVQAELLEIAATLLLPGGVLVYATCSLEPEENVDIIEQFLKNNPQFKLADCRPCLPDTAFELVRENCFQPRPSELTDGFFAARLVRNIADD